MQVGRKIPSSSSTGLVVGLNVIQIHKGMF
jgi:hypothetical protein